MKTVVRFLVPILAALAFGPQLPAQPKADVSDDLEAERKLLELPPGFEIQLVASEPTVVNPVQMQFDPRGRLWVLCLPRYPQLLPGQDPRDFIVVLEDFDASGRARKSHVFADKLMIPTGLAPGDGGCYVGQAEKLWHFRDTKGTGTADERRVLFTGFGSQDTHHTLNSFRWGPDGFLYFNQGIYIKSTVETPHGPRKLWGGCVWQLRPDRLRLEVYDRSILGNNTWGHVFDSWGQSFCTSAWPADINLVLPDTPLNTSSEKGVVPPLPLTKVGDGRHCGAGIITGRHFPDEYQGNIVTGAFHSQQVQRWSVREGDPKPAAQRQAPLVVSKHRKFRPVDVQMGPDGALYIADWYDEIIQHNQIDFRDPRRDHSRGRIWRVVRKDRPLLPIPKLVGVPVDDVLEHLKSPEAWARQQAKRALAERDVKEVAAGLQRFFTRIDAGHPKAAHHLLEALWTAQTIDHVDPALLVRVLRSEDARARAAATRVVGYWHDRLDDPLGMLAISAGDVSPRVRLEAVLAASRIPSARAVEVALLAIEHPTEPLIDFALEKTALVLKPYWLPEFQKGKLTFGGSTRAMTAALRAIRDPEALKQLNVVVASGSKAAEALPGFLEAVASTGAPGALDIPWGAVLDGVRAGPLPREARLRVMAALERAAREKRATPTTDTEKVATLIADRDPAVSAAAIRLAGAWKQKAARGELERIAAGEPGARRRAALAALVDLGGAESVALLERLVDRAKDYASRRDAIVGLTTLDPRRAAAPAGTLLQQPVSAGHDPSDVYLAFLQRSGGPAALADALTQATPSADAAKIGVRVLNSVGTSAPALARLLHDAAGVTGKSRDVSPEEVQRLLALVRSGDAARGEYVFRRPALGCLQCHAVGGAGGRVGPDLSGIGASAQLDYLLESILLPSKVIREGYNTVNAITADGRAHAGIVLRESDKELVLRTATQDEVTVAKADVEQRAGGGSLMPAGLDQQLTDAELADLVRFLSELGRPGPFAVSHVPVARRWQYVASAPPSVSLLAPAGVGTVLRDDARLVWQTAFGRVSGDLDLREVTLGPGKEVAVVRTQIDVVSPGRVEIRFNDDAGLDVWLDGNPQHPGGPLVAELPRGTHTLDVRLRLRDRKDPVLRCELHEGKANAAVARFVGGK